MKRNAKYLALILSLAMAMGLVGCGASTEAESTAQEES